MLSSQPPSCKCEGGCEHDAEPGQELCQECQKSGCIPVGTSSDYVSKSQYNSVDENGKYCGLVEVTGEMAPTPVGKVGYCGPTCAHCVDFKVYALEHGIWVCAADSDLERINNEYY